MESEADIPAGATPGRGPLPAGLRQQPGATDAPPLLHVPPRTERIGLYAQYTAAGPPRFFAPNGSEVKPTLLDGGQLIVLQVPEGQRGAVWSLDRAKAPIEPIRLLNAPRSFAFSAEALLVPADAFEPRTP